MRLRNSYVILIEKVCIKEIITEVLEGVRQFTILKLRGRARARSPKYNVRGNKKTLRKYARKYPRGQNSSQLRYTQGHYKMSYIKYF